MNGLLSFGSSIGAMACSLDTPQELGAHFPE